MLLTVDIGNSVTKLALFDGEHITARWRLTTAASATPDELAIQLGCLLGQQDLRLSHVDRIVVGGVVPALTRSYALLGADRCIRAPLTVTPELSTGVDFGEYDPLTLGADRLANIVAAKALYPAPSAIVDLGTATNIEVIGRNGNFLGGVIAPGIATAVAGLLGQAALLRPFPLDPPRRAIGRSTVECLQAGSVLGHVAMIEGLLSRIRSEMQDEPLVIGAGGYATLAASVGLVFGRIDPDITSLGLRLIGEMNPP